MKGTVATAESRPPPPLLLADPPSQAAPAANVQIGIGVQFPSFTYSSLTPSLSHALVRAEFWKGRKCSTFSFRFRWHRRSSLPVRGQDLEIDYANR